MPVICNVLWPTRERALHVPRVDIRLAFCRQCGHIFNPDFDPTMMDYTEAYENSLHFSPRFQRYADQLAADLVARHQLYNKTIIDIGGGKGDFLTLLCQLGNNRGISIDPSYAPPAAQPTQSAVSFIQDYYSEKYAHLAADFVCSRHTLEHIQHPAEFVTMLRRTLDAQQQSVLFFEMPNALFTLHDLAIWDIIYEHCSYFTNHSLAYLFRASGFQVLDVHETFAGQFLCIEAIPAPRDAGEPWQDELALAQLAEDVAAFATNYQTKVQHERALLTDMRQVDKKAVIWGAGSKGITFLNTLQLQDQIEYAVDINPRKHGMYITGTGQQIVPPEFLRTYRPDVVIVMNPVYTDEIYTIVRELGLSPELLPA